MHANFHILYLSSANMTFSLAIAQTAQAFLSLSLALASSLRPYLPFTQLLLPFPELSFPFHWQVGEHPESQTSPLEPNVQFHSHEDRLGYQPEQRKDTQDLPYNGYNLRISSQNCTNSNLFLKHKSAHYTYAHMNPRNYQLMKTYQQNTIPGKYKFRVSHSKLALKQNLKP